MTDRNIQPQTWKDQPGVNSAVIDLEDMEMNIEDDYETEFSDHSGAKGQDRTKSKGVVDDVRQRLQDNVTKMIWDSSTQSAKKAWTLYGNIDILRPYFNVEPHEVRQRLLSSLFPKLPRQERQKVHRELYGPMMVIFTLIALLLFQMKTSDHRVEEGTLMGTAFGVCFTYWFGASGFLWFLAYVCNVQISLVQLLSMLGYGLFGHCVVLFLGTVIHTSHDHLFFYLLWTVIGGLATLRMVAILISRTHGQTQRMIVCCTLAVFHLIFLLYLHFAYHQIVEELSETFQHHAASGIPVMKEPIDKPVDTLLPKAIKMVTKAVIKRSPDVEKLALSNGTIKQLARHVIHTNETVRAVIGGKVA